MLSAVPSQLIAERGANLVVINPGSANVRIGFAHQAMPFNIPHCIARHVEEPAGWKFEVKDRLLNSEATPAQKLDREKAYDEVAALLKIPFLDEEVAANNSFTKVARVEGHNSHSSGRTDTKFTWTDVVEKNPNSSLLPGNDKGSESIDQSAIVDDSAQNHCEYRKIILGDEALKISPNEPYCLCHPIRRGHLNVSQHYSLQQVLEDIYAIWNWIISEKLHILSADRNSYSAVLVIPETFDSREIKELLSIALRDLGFGFAVIHQEGLAAASGSGLSTACVVNLGAHVTSIICVEDGVALPSTAMILPFGGDDISRCLLWIQENLHTWPNIRTNPLIVPIDLLMLNKIKESYCLIREGEFDAVALVNSYGEGISVGSHKSRLSSLNVPPMGLFFPNLFVPEEYPPPPNSWLNDHEDMLDDMWRPENSDIPYIGSNSGLTMWDNYPVFQSRIKKMDKIGLANAITSSILSTGRIDLQRKLFCSIQLIGGVALTTGLVAAVEERVLHAIPSNEAIDTVEVLQSRTDPPFVPWKGGAILGILDFSREAWIHREDWIKNGIHVGSGRKYKDSFYLQAISMSYINS